MGGKSYKTLILLSCFLTACVKDKPGSGTKLTPDAAGIVYVVCEGNFGTGDASLYAYVPRLDSVYGDLYENTNNQPLGDVFQSMQRIGDKLFLSVNNSDKVIILNADNWTLAGAISIPKPRYILPINAGKAYVSTLYSNKVYIINPQTMQVTDTIAMPNSNPEGMCLYNNEAIICTWDTAGNSLFKVDVTTDKVVQSIKLAGYAPQEVLLDKQQMLWVLSGNQPQGKTCALTRVDPSTGEILRSFQFPAAADAIRPVFNNTKDTLYFIEANYYGGTTNNGVYRIGINDVTLPTQPFVQAKQYQYFWAVGVDPLTDDIYIGDPKGFTQNGNVYVYEPGGSLVHTFNVGVGPGHFYFDE